MVKENLREAERRRPQGETHTRSSAQRSPSRQKSQVEEKPAPSVQRESEPRKWLGRQEVRNMPHFPTPGWVKCKVAELGGPFAL